jgi:hypothetical protein
MTMQQEIRDLGGTNRPSHHDSRRAAGGISSARRAVEHVFCFETLPAMTPRGDSL